ncbi:MAG: bifunctional 23S rRNA (guanine(2069)-N(7))-methyltransferase RlmK/23S rRNA (guanine(2445)-N(2))-methyltransferase RlmL [Pirellulaceae bacterium]|nr:bifunctional 23S rRNA (guanine(2069)-N(7))-methyltransferase RlmK/23S rRNA (guanine(2445)-N(2))-methyltransferase RlmL [Pirellulaceae bacterium]
MNSTFDLIAACAFGLEAVVRRELAALDIEASIGESGRVHFRGDFETICKANLWLRTADRVLIRVAQFSAPDFDALFDTVRDIRWGEILPSDAAFPVTGRSIKSTLTSVPACQRTVKRAIVDAMKRDHDTTLLTESGAEHKIDVALLKDTATITIDTTGRSLHRRGYRTDISAAPLKETLAAAMVMLSYWRRDRPMLDPFCGSGTIPIEAARIGRNMAPGLIRDFAAESWPMFPDAAWSQMREAAREAELPALEERIIGSDINGKVLRAARDNAVRAGVENDIHFQSRSVSQASSRRRFGCLITNPPYGRRLGADRELDQLYQSLPEVLRHLPTWSFYFLTAYPRFEATMGRQADRRRKLYNGRIECTYYQFHGPKPLVEKPRDDIQAADDTISDRGESAADDSTDAGADQPVPPSALTADSTPESITNEAVSDIPAAEKPAKAKPYVHAVGDAAFGHLGDKASEQAGLFRSRLKKLSRHLRRWPTRRGITCVRLYERDIPEIPLVVDRYENYLHITEYERPHDRDPAQHANWLELMAHTASETLEIPEKNVYLKTRARQRGKTQHEKIDQAKHEVTVSEGGLKFLINLSDYVDTGLFLDHRNTRQMVRELAEGKTFLNLFAYTGSFTVYAAAGGAKRTVSVDLSKSYLDWAKRNMQLNGFDGDQHQFIAADVGQFVRGHAPGEMYDLVLLDPPTFSNSKRTEQDWNVQSDCVPLITDLLPLVRKGGVIYFSNNFRRFKFDPDSIPASEVHEITKQTIPEDFRNKRIHRCWRIVR